MKELLFLAEPIAVGRLEACDSEGCEERIRAILEKRTPAFQGV